MTPLDAIQAIATTDPRGGEIVSAPVNNGIPGGAVPALGGPGAAPVDVAINAVIVSAAQSPWDAIRRYGPHVWLQLHALMLGQDLCRSA